MCLAVQTTAAAAAADDGDDDNIDDDCNILKRLSALYIFQHSISIHIPHCINSWYDFRRLFSYLCLLCALLFLFIRFSFRSSLFAHFVAAIVNASKECLQHFLHERKHFQITWWNARLGAIFKMSRLDCKRINTIFAIIIIIIVVIVVVRVLSTVRSFIFTIIHSISADFIRCDMYVTYAYINLFT